MTKLSDEQDEALRAAAEAVVESVLPDAQKIAEATDRDVTAVVASLFRPYLKEVADPAENAAETTHDMRERKWDVKLYFWDVNKGLEAAELLAETDTETVVGLTATIPLIRDYVDDLHGGISGSEEFSVKALKSRIAKLRPSIWRGGGKAQSRIQYFAPDGSRCMCQVEIKHAEESS